MTIINRCGVTRRKIRMMTTERFADSEQMPPELVSLLENLPDDQLKEVLEMVLEELKEPTEA